MKRRLHNEDGITLAELLATLAIAGFIMVFIMSAFIFVQKQFSAQKTSLQQNTDISIALKSITRDARMAEKFTNPNDEEVILFISDDESITYALDGNILKKNNADYIYGIESFKVNNVHSTKLRVEIKSESGKKISTEIVLREGNQ